MMPLLEYWEGVKKCFCVGGSVGLAQVTSVPKSLREGFWPCTNHGTGYKHRGEYNEHLIETPQSDLEGLEQELREELQDREEIFVGAPQDKEQE